MNAVKCVNPQCEMRDKVFPLTIELRPDELVMCGGCGCPCEFTEADDDG